MGVIMRVVTVLMIGYLVIFGVFLPMFISAQHDPLTTTVIHYFRSIVLFIYDVVVNIIL